MGLKTFLLVAALSALVVPASSQTTVRSARLYADLSPDDGVAEVRIEYELDVRGTPELRFELLGFGSATTGAFWLGEERTGTQIRLDTETGSMRAASFTLRIAPTDEPYHLVAQYWIAEAVQHEGGRVRALVPVLSLALPPADGVRDLFRAELTLPPAWSIAEGFPSGLEDDGAGAYAVDLPVVPSLVRVRGRTDGTWRPGVPLLFEVLIGSILLASGLLGWRHLSRAAS